MRAKTSPVLGRALRLSALAFAAAALGACASFSADGGFGSVEQTARAELGKDVRWAKSEADQDSIDERVAELLAKPLSADDAVQIALLNNKGLQASFSELGISEADLVQAGRLPNPGFTFGRLKRGDEIEIDRSVQFNIARLLILPLIRQVESRRFEHTQRMVAQNVLSLAAETRKSYFRAVAAEETVRYTQKVRQAAEASAELARRMEQAGNFNKLQRAREQSFYADAALNQARAEASRTAAREQLTRLLGLWGTQTQFTLPERLPDLPAVLNDLPDVERVALARRLDVQAAKVGAEQTAKNLGLARVTRFVNVLEFTLERNSFSEPPAERGYEISVELPLFDWGDARLARAEAVYMQALNRAAQTAIEARSEVRQAYSAYRSSFDIAMHYRDEILPLQQRIADENLLRYNGMLIGVFELLADARAQIASVNSYIESLRDFWIARADLDLAMIGKPGLSAPALRTTAAPAGGAPH